MRKITNEELHRPSVEEFAAMPKLPLVVVLDNVRSAQNVGSFFRTGDAFAVERIALCGITAVPPCRELHKTALGAEQSVAWTHHASTVECIDELRAAGYRVLAVEQVEGIDTQVLGKTKRGTCPLVQTHDVAGRQARKRLMAFVRVEIDGKVRRRKTARTQFDVEQVTLDGRAHRKLGRRTYRDLAQAVAEHDLAELGQRRQTLGEQAEQTLVVALPKRQAALVKIEVHGSRVHNAKLRHHVAGRHAGALVFKRTSRSTQAKEICRPIAVGNRDLAGHKAIVDTDLKMEARLGRHGIERGRSGQFGVVAQDRQRHAAELAHLVGGDMSRRAAGQQTR